MFLLEKVNEYSQHPYSFFLDKAVAEATSETELMLDKSSTDFHPEQSETEKAALIRYLLLEAELEAEGEEDEALKAELSNTKLKAIAHNLEAATQNDANTDSIGGIDEVTFKNHWGHLCDSANDFIIRHSSDSEEDLIDIIRVINADLQMDEVIVPSRKEQNGEVVHVREESNRSQELMAKLLAERNAAEAEINMKITELERL